MPKLLYLDEQPPECRDDGGTPGIEGYRKILASYYATMGPTGKAAVAQHKARFSGMYSKPYYMGMFQGLMVGVAALVRGTYQGKELELDENNTNYFSHQVREFFQRAYTSKEAGDYAWANLCSAEAMAMACLEVFLEMYDATAPSPTPKE